MKLATFTTGTAPELGIVDGKQIACLSRAAPALAGDMIDLIARWKQIEPEVRRISQAPSHTLKLEDVRLLAPILRPRKILAIGLNYADHIEETGMPRPEHQIWFSKMPTAINGPFDPIDIPRAGPAVDFEPELVAVNSTGGRDPTELGAQNAGFAFCSRAPVIQTGSPMWSPPMVLRKSSYYPPPCR